MRRHWRVPSLLITLGMLGSIMLFAGYRQHDKMTMGLALGWYLGVIMGCVTFYQLPVGAASGDGQ